MEAGLALLSSFSSFPSSSCYPHPHQRNPTLLCTFRTITSNWRKDKNSLATQGLLFDIAWSRRLGFVYGLYPTYIVDELLSLLGNIFEGQIDSRIVAKIAAARLGLSSKRVVMREGEMVRQGTRWTAVPQARVPRRLDEMRRDETRKHAREKKKHNKIDTQESYIVPSLKGGSLNTFWVPAR
jgi:hypothetical protein